ncbi:hypothetical protein LUZ60_013855 [Juncus effusus]|nr:hypothetical protein LUZ60_013855 [Juncus effusus]
MFILVLAILQSYTGYSNAQSSLSTIVPAIITFGDSMMDVGNNNHLSADFKANYRPYGRDFKNHRPTGRFCNGKLPTDITAKRYNELKIAVFDIYQPLYELITAPSKQGFVEAQRGCCVTGTSGKTSVLCKPELEGICSNATSYVFWDSVHPSEAANRVIAGSLLVDGLQLI